MLTLREIIADAEKRNVAIGHFNAPNIEIIRAIINAAGKLSVPVIIGFSEGERDFFGLKQAVDYVKSVRDETGLPIFSNADHTYSVDRVKEAVNAGFDAVIFDGAKLSLDENISQTKECVDYAKASGKEVLLEGELGFIGSGSKILEEIPEGAVITEEHMTTPDDTERFVSETGVDLFAPAVGNIHGILKSGREPALSSKRIKEIKNVVEVPLVLHGASGNSHEDIRKAIEAGISIVHVSTELRIAYRDAVESAIKTNRKELAPYKLMQPVVDAVQNVVETKLRLFNAL